MLVVKGDLKRSESLVRVFTLADFSSLLTLAAFLFSLTHPTLLPQFSHKTNFQLPSGDPRGIKRTKMKEIVAIDK